MKSHRIPNRAKQHGSLEVREAQDRALVAASLGLTLLWAGLEGKHLLLCMAMGVLLSPGTASSGEEVHILGDYPADVLGPCANTPCTVLIM